MTDQTLIARYNYDEFVLQKFEQWLNFEASPPLGQPAPDFPLWRLDRMPTRYATSWASRV